MNIGNAEKTAAMRILHIITSLNTGGAETALCRLLEILRPPAFEHVVVALGQQGTLSARVQAVADIHHLGMNAARPRPADFWQLRRIVRSSAPDVVHGWMYHANIAATFGAIGFGIPVLWGIRHSLHDLASEKRSTRLVIKGGVPLSLYPRHILYNSIESARQHEHLGYVASRTRIIANGFDVEAFRPDVAGRLRVRSELELPPDALLIGLVARVHPMKDHANFLRAAAMLTQVCARAYFVLVGDGADACNPELTGLIGELGLQGRVLLCGRRTDIAAIDVALDIACLSSSSEAFPNAIGEAMACGVPCVATDVGDVAQIIGDTGVVVPARDARALADGLGKLAVLDEAARRVLGLHARQRIVEHYSLASVAAQYADTYVSSIRKG